MLPGIYIPAMITIGSDNDTYPTHASLYGLGGHKEVATLAERDAIPDARLTIGTEVYVASEGKTFTLTAKGPNQWVDRNQVIYDLQSTLQQQITQLQTRVSQTEADIANINTRIQTILATALPQAVQAQIQAALVDYVSQEDFNALVARVVLLETQTAGFQSLIDNLSDEIDQLQTNNEQFNATVQQYVSQTTSNTEDIAGLQAFRQSTTTTLVTINSNITSIDQQIIALQSGLVAVNQSISTFNQSIHVINTTLSNLATADQQIIARVASLESSRTAINLEIEAIKEDLYPVVITLSANSTVFQKGTRDVTLNWSTKYDNVEITPTSLYIRRTVGSQTILINLNTSLKTYTMSLNASQTLTLIVEYNGLRYTESIDIVFVNPTYYGAVSATPTAATLVSLNLVLKAEHNLEWRNASTNNKLCYVSPNSLGLLDKIEQDGLNVIRSFTRTDIVANGEIYRVYTLTDDVVLNSVNLIFK